MKKMILYCCIIAIIAGACARNKPTEKTVLGMGSNYYLIPQTFNGKIKEIKEINYWAIEKDGQITKGQMMTKKDLDSIGSTPNLIVNFN